MTKRLFPLAIAARPLMALAEVLDPRPSRFKRDPGASKEQKPRGSVAFAKWKAAHDKRERKAAKLQAQRHGA